MSGLQHQVCASSRSVRGARLLLCCFIFFRICNIATHHSYLSHTSHTSHLLAFQTIQLTMVNNSLYPPPRSPRNPEHYQQYLTSSPQRHRRYSHNNGSHSSSSSSGIKPLHLYWYLIFPALVVFAIWSLIDMSRSIYRDSHIYNTAPRVQQRQYQFATQQQLRNKAGYPRPYYGGGGGGGGGSTYTSPQYSYSSSNNNWWNAGDSQVGGKPSYPKFLSELETERQALLKLAKKALGKSSPAATAAQSWPMAKTPSRQSIKFLPPVLPFPQIPPEARANMTTAILVLSGQNNFIRRQAIRKTWKGTNTNVFFIIGQSDCPMMKKTLVTKATRMKN